MTIGLKTALRRLSALSAQKTGARMAVSFGAMVTGIVQGCVYNAKEPESVRIKIVEPAGED